MPPTVNQEINVNINALVKRIQDVRELVGLVRNLRERSTGKVSVDEKISANAKASTLEVDRLVGSIESLQKSIDSIDERRFSRLAAAASVVGTIYSAITNVPAFVEGVKTLKDLSNKAPAIAGGISSIANSARDLVQITRQRVGDGLTKAKDAVSGLAAKLPGIGSSGAAATGIIGRIGVAGAGAAVGIGALAIALGVVAVVIGAILATVAIFAFLFRLSQGAAEAGSEIHDLTQELGVSAETLSTLKVATQTTSTTFEEAAGFVSKFNKLIGEAADGSKEAARNLTRLGVDPQKALKNNEAALAAVFKRIHELPTPYEKARASQIAFGKSGAAMVPVIESVGGSLDEAKKKAAEFGQLLSTQAARDADEFGDQIDELKLRVEGFGLSIGRTLIPELLKLLRIFSHEMPGAGGLFQTVLEAIRLKVETLVNEVIIAIAALNTLAALPSALAVVIATGDLASAFNIIKERFKKELTDLIVIANTPPTGGGATGPDFPFGPTDSKDAKKPASTFEAELQLRATKAQNEFNLEKDLLDNLTAIYADAFENRRIATEDYFRAVEGFRRRHLAAEIKLNTELAKIEKARHDAEIKEIEKDTDTTPAQKVNLKINAENKFSAATAELDAQLKVLTRAAQDLPREIEAGETAALKSLDQQITAFLAKVDELNGRTAHAAAEAIDAEFRELLERITVEQGENSPLVKLIREFIRELKAQAQFREALTRFDRIDAQRQTKVDLVSAGAPNNQLGEFQVRQEVNRVNAEYLRLLKEQIVALEARAKEEGATPEIQNEIDKRKAAVFELQQSLNNTQLRDTAIDSLISGAQQFSSTVLTSVRSLKDLKNAALSFAQSFLDALSQVIIKLLVMKALSAIFGNVGGVGGAGGVGAAGAAKFATGGDIPATPGGRLAVIGEAGFDEMVVTTDPRHSGRTASLLGAFISRTGIMPRFSAAGFALSVANSLSAIPRLAAGAIVPAPSPAQLAAATTSSSFAVRNVNLFDPADLLDALQSSGGERVVLNVISKNPQRFRAALGV